MRLERFHFVIAALTLLLVLGAVGCGEDDDCASDHDCDDDYVCEPSGCQLACSSDADCPATDECAARRVEDGTVCTPK